ncbi:MAG: hypothetical protein AB1468_00660 [Candidatus Micrarchaeota archaeon]
MAFYILTKSGTYKAVVKDGFLGYDPEWRPRGFKPFSEMRFGTRRESEQAELAPEQIFILWGSEKLATSQEVDELRKIFLELFDDKKLAEDALNGIATTANKCKTQLRYLYLRDVEEGKIVGIEFSTKIGEVRVSRDRITGTGAFKHLSYEKREEGGEKSNTRF